MMQSMMQSDSTRRTLPEAVTRTLELDSRELEERLSADRPTPDGTTADIGHFVDTSHVSTAPIAGLAERVAELDHQLPAGWSRATVDRWCEELVDSLRRFGMHALDAMTPSQTEAFERQWGIPLAEAFRAGPVGRAIREFYGIHRRDEHGMSCADFAASSAQHMGPYLGKFAPAVALSCWDLYAVETSGGECARLRSLRTGERVDVHATLVGQRFEPKTFVIARIVPIQNLTVATTVVRCSAECTIAALGELRRKFKGRSSHAFMRREGSRILLGEILRALQAGRSSLRDRFRDCSNRDVIALHALHAGLEVAVDEDRLVSNVTAIGDVAGWVEVVDDGVRFVVQRGDQTWEFSRVSSSQLSNNDLSWLESLGLRPRMHGAVVCPCRVPDWCIPAAEMMVTRIT